MIEEHGACDFEVLLSCMHQDNFDIAYKTKVDSDLLIINQCDREDYQEISVNGYLWRMISTTDRGSSQSRNLALDHARGEICLLCDDDEVYCEGYRDNVLTAFMQLPQANLIGFNVHRINVTMKKKYYTISNVKETDRYRCFASPMLAFRLEDIKHHNLRFNEQFGSGAQWGPGEDSLFQRDARNEGLKLYEYPEYIATQDYSNESKWFRGYTEEYFYNQGAYAEFCNTPRIKREIYNIYSFFYKYRRERTLSPFQKFVWKHRGERGWREKVTYEQYIKNGNKYR